MNTPRAAVQYPEYLQTWSPFINFFTFACVTIAMLIYLCVYVTILEDRLAGLKTSCLKFDDRRWIPRSGGS
jgi:hypothetical protein